MLIFTPLVWSVTSVRSKTTNNVTMKKRTVRLMLSPKDGEVTKRTQRAQVPWMFLGNRRIKMSFSELHFIVGHIVWEGVIHEL